MSKINIVSNLMDMVPSRNKEGFVPVKEKKAYAVIAWERSSACIDAIKNGIRYNRHYSYLNEQDQDGLAAIMQGAVEYRNMLNGAQLFCLKLQVDIGEQRHHDFRYSSQISEIFGDVDYFRIFEDDEPTLCTRSRNVTMSENECLYLYNTMRTVVCNSTVNTSRAEFDLNLHGITIQR